jgi:hypothetical protein
MHLEHADPGARVEHVERVALDGMEVVGRCPEAAGTPFNVLLAGGDEHLVLDVERDPHLIEDHVRAARRIERREAGR